MPYATFFDLSREMRDLVYAELWDRNTVYSVKYAGYEFAVRPFPNGTALHQVALGAALPRDVIANRQLSREAIGQLQISASLSIKGRWASFINSPHEHVSTNTAVFFEHLSPGT